MGDHVRDGDLDIWVEQVFTYTPRAHDDGMVDQFIEEVFAFPHKQAPEDVQRFLDAFFAREDRATGCRRSPRRR